MNARAAAALYEAERKGVKQIKGHISDGAGGLCAYGVIKAADYDTAMGLLGTKAGPCPLCGAREGSEAFQVSHLNDDHGLTFAEIARKLGPDDV